MSDAIVMRPPTQGGTVLRTPGGAVVVRPDPPGGAVAIRTSGAPGPQGPAGPTGPSAADANYVHEQMAASTVWNVVHALGAFPNVTVLDSLGDVVHGPVEYLDNQSLRLTFSSAMSGRAYLS